jgi:hypothetical protein
MPTRPSRTLLGEKKVRITLEQRLLVPTSASDQLVGHPEHIPESPGSRSVHSVHWAAEVVTGTKVTAMTIAIRGHMIDSFPDGASGKLPASPAEPLTMGRVRVVQMGIARFFFWICCNSRMHKSLCAAIAVWSLLAPWGTRHPTASPRQSPIGDSGGDRTSDRRSTTGASRSALARREA